MATPDSPPPSARSHARWTRHAAVLALAGALVWAFWRSRMEWTADMRLWRAVGDAAFVLLSFTLATGPLAALWPRARRLLAWRRSFGVTAALAAALHAYLVWDGWALWSLRRLFGYQDLSEAGGPDNVLVDPGFGLANLVGIVALAWALLIAAISSDHALRLLGQRSWKFVQQFAYVVFYLTGLHAAYFLFLHYELSLVNLVFRKGVPEPNWFRAWFVLIVVAVFVLQLAAFVRQVQRDRAQAGRAVPRSGRSRQRRGAEAGEAAPDIAAPGEPGKLQP